MHDNRINQLIEPDENKVTQLTAVVAAPQLFQKENTRRARRLLAGAVRDYLEEVLGREPGGEQIRGVRRKEM
jgi:hypothetical protein